MPLIPRTGRLLPAGLLLALALGAAGAALADQPATLDEALAAAAAQNKLVVIDFMAEW